MARTPTRSGVDVTAPTSAVMVVRVVPSALDFCSSRNFVASAASVFCWAAPFAHLNVPAEVAVPMSQWYPVGHSAELVQASFVTSTWHPAASSSAAANERTAVFCIGWFPPEKVGLLKNPPPPRPRRGGGGGEDARARARPPAPAQQHRGGGVGR